MDTPPAILAFGSRDPVMFQDGQATDQIIFLARVIERCFRSWLNICCVKAESVAKCADDLAQTLYKWSDYLQFEKNLSRHTLRAYGADVAHFITFLFDHLATQPSLNDLSAVSIRDFRGWMGEKGDGWHIECQPCAVFIGCEKLSRVAG